MSEFITKFAPQSCQPIRLGGEPGLSAADISHACTMANGIGWYLIQIKFIGDLSGYSVLRDLMMDRISEEAYKCNWPKERIASLVMLSISEYTGTRIWQDNERAKAIGVHPSGWCRVWKSKYRRLMEVMEAYEQSTLHLVRNRLKY